VLDARLPTRSITDVVSLDTWLAEQAQTASAAAAGLSMGVNIPLSARRVPLSLMSALRCDSKAAVGSPSGDDDGDDASASEFVMVVERQTRHSTSVAALSSGLGLSEDDTFVFLHHWLSGQLDLVASSGMFHLDGHTANVLVNTTATPYTFAWNDFGRTTSHPGHPDEQLKKTIRTVAVLARKHASLECAAQRLDRVSALRDLTQDGVKDTFLGALSCLEDLSLMAQSRVVSRLSGRRMGARVARLERIVEELRKENAELRSTVGSFKSKMKNSARKMR
jgi:hypothetical protein